MDAAAPPGDPRLAGCVVAFAGMVLMTVTPALGGWFEITPPLGFGVLAAAVFLLFAGAAVGLGGSALRARAEARRRAEAQAVLRDWHGNAATREGAIRAAVQYLDAGGALPDPGEPGPAAALLRAVAGGSPDPGADRAG